MATGALEDIRELLKEQNALLRRQRGVVGGSLLEALPFLDGWTWFQDSGASPILLTRGAQRVRLINWTDERGWILAGYVIFSDPDALIQMVIDNITMLTSPRQMNTTDQLQVGFTRISAPVYDPAGGPQYGVMVGSFQGLPYKSQAMLDVWLPQSALNATGYVWFYLMSKILINNEKLFYESVERLGARQTAGSKDVKPVG